MAGRAPISPPESPLVRAFCDELARSIAGAVLEDLRQKFDAHTAGHRARSNSVEARSKSCDQVGDQK